MGMDAGIETFIGLQEVDQRVMRSLCEFDTHAKGGFDAPLFWSYKTRNSDLRRKIVTS